MPVVQLSGASLQSVAGSDAHTEGADAALVEVLAVATALGSASDLATLLHQILRACRHLTASDAGSVYLIEPARRSRGNPPTGLPQDQPESGQAQLWFAASQNASIGQAEGIASDLAPQLLDSRFPLSPERLVGWCALEGEVLNIANVYALPPDLPYRFDASVDRQLGYRAVSMLSVPMRSTTGEVVGVLQLINRKHRASDRLEPATAEALTRPYDRQDQRLIEAMASLAAVSVERTLLIAQQDGLIEAIVTLLASAIDAKSAYTGGLAPGFPSWR
jgi:GAF domain-containing protein